MKATSVASVGIVPELLTYDNYDRWSGFMESYLIGQDLWNDVIEITRDDDIEQGRRKDITEYSMSDFPKNKEGSLNIKNAKALHIIRISCSRQIQNQVGFYNTARTAWLQLKYCYGGITQAISQQVTDSFDDSLSQENKELARKVERGDYIENIINSNSDIWITSRESNRTLLHVAVIVGNVDNVKILMAKGGQRLLLAQDKHGDTALSLVARYTGNTDVAKCLVATKHGPHEDLLEKPNRDYIIPILMAAANGHKELTAYLYTQTVSKSKSKLFEETDSQNRILLLSLCITFDIFDVALKLLNSYNELAKESLSSYNFSVPNLLRVSLSISSLNQVDQPISPIEALAKRPSLFPSGNRFGFREKLIYNRKFSCLHYSLIFQLRLNCSVGFQNFTMFSFKVN
ncbi:hypothetical protein P8452_41986 [Trifolium repens]|nr:hypothetical protein P8452_41986 [Trifolium repens]